MKHAFETFAKTFETIVNIRSIQIKQLHYIYENICNIHINTLATYIEKNK
jgi:hypothetical protein